MVLYMEKLYNGFLVRAAGLPTTGYRNHGNTQLALDQNEILVKQNSRLIKKIVKEKIGLYQPLDFKTAYPYILSRLADPGNEKIDRTTLSSGDAGKLAELVKELLIEHAYYLLVNGGFIQRLVMNKLNITNCNDISVHERTDFIREALEKDNFKNLKNFQEKASFKTFLYTLTNRLFFDFWRDHYKKEGAWEKFFNDAREFSNSNISQPLENLILQENEEFLAAAGALLPGILEKMGETERLSIKMKYEKDLNVSVIARTLGFSRYKTELLIKRVECNIKEELLWALTGKGGSHEASAG